MNNYSRALRHINIKDVKQKHQRKLIEQKIQEENLKKEEEYITSVMEDKKYDWRSELEKIEQKPKEELIVDEFVDCEYSWRDKFFEEKKKYFEEGMTSSGTFFTTLPATGDADLIGVDVSDSSSYAFTDNVSYGESGLSFDPYGTTPYAITNTIDTSTSDSISFTGFANPSFSTKSDLEILWYNNDSGAYGFLPGIIRTSTSSATYNVSLPSGARGPNVDFTFLQPRSSANSSQDFDGKPVYIGGQLAQLYPGRSSSGLGNAIVIILANYGIPGRESALNLGKSIILYVSQNKSTVSGYEDIFGRTDYPGIPGPVSGNIGDPNITGFNADLSYLKNNQVFRSAAFMYGYFGANTQQQMIDLFSDTTFNGAQFYLDIREWDRLTDLRDSFYSQYVYYDNQGNTALANYYLNLSNENRDLATNKENAILASIDAAETLPDSQWTDADYEKVAADIYNLYKDVKTYTITNFSTKRRAPVNVFVGLDSPEATSFIRTDPIMSNLSPQERLKKLKEMLDASDEYVTKMLGSDFPGTGAVPPGEFNPFAQTPPGQAGDTPGVQVTDYQNAPGYMNIKVGDKEITRQYDSQGNYTGADTGWQPDPNAQPQSQSTSKKINFTHTYDVVLPGGAIEKRTMDLSTNVSLDAKGNYVQSPRSQVYPSQSQSQSQAQTPPGKAGDTTGAKVTDFDMEKYIDSLPPGVKDDLLNGAVPFDPFIDGLIASLTKAGKVVQSVGALGKAFDNWFNKGRNQRIPDERNASWKKLWDDDLAQRGQSDASYAAGKPPTGIGRPDQALNPFRPASKGGPGSGPTPLGRRVGELAPKPAIAGASSGTGNNNNTRSKGSRRGAAVNNSYEPEGQMISEKRKLKSPKELLDKIPGYYDGKPAPLGFPVEPPPEMKNGMHPDLVDGKKVSDRFNRLDPVSAKAMPLTGNPHIDKKVKAARKKPK